MLLTLSLDWFFIWTNNTTQTCALVRLAKRQLNYVPKPKPVDQHQSEINK